VQSLRLTSRANAIFVDATRQQKARLAPHSKQAVHFDEPDLSSTSAVQLHTYLNYGGKSFVKLEETFVAHASRCCAIDAARRGCSCTSAIAAARP